MNGTPPERHHSMPWFRDSRMLLALFFTLLGIFLFVNRGYHDERLALSLRDFKQPYASARCLLQDCNPYSEAATENVYEQAGGTNQDRIVFAPYSALYPPFSLALLAPVAALRFPLAAQVWMAIIAVLFSCAVLFTGLVCMRLAPVSSAGLLCLLAATSTILLMLGQITGPVVELLAIGCCCMLLQRAPAVAVACFTIAAVLKPHDAAFVILYLLFATRAWRRVFAWTLGCSLLLALAGILWCSLEPASAHWLGELRANLAGNSMPGAVNDPHRGFVDAANLADLQAVTAPLLPAPILFKTAAAAVSALLFLAWLVPALRMRNCLPKHLLALACMAVFTLLPVYHRQYDSRLLLLALPAVAWLVVWRRLSWGAAGVVLFLGATLVSSHQYIHVLTGGHLGSVAAAGPWKTVLVFRPLVLAALAMLVFLLAAFWAVWRESERVPLDALPGQTRFPAALTGGVPSQER